MPRRAATLLITLLGIFASCHSSAAEKPDQAALDKLGWRFACQAYTFRAMSLFETLDVLNKLGVRYVEMYPGQRLSPDDPKLRVGPELPPEQIERLKQKLKDTGVEANSFGVTELSNDEAKARKTFEFAKAMGMRTIVSEPPQDALPLLDRLSAEYGIRIAIHNHPKPNSRYWDCHTLLEALQNCSDRIGACADTGHWYRSGLVPVECLKLLDGRVIESHFKDLNAEKNDVPWGTGECDVRGMLTELKRQGKPVTIIVEYESTTGQELIDNVGKCIEQFNKIARELAK